MIRLFSILLIFVVGLGVSLNAQQVIATSGGQGVHSNFSLTWTVGQPEGAFFANTNLGLSQGFQQPFLETVGIEESDDNAAFAQSKFLIFPNPFQSFFEVVIPDSSEINMRVVNGLGQVIYFENRSMYSQNSVRINTEDWNAGIYHLILSEMNTGNNPHTYKLIKY